MSAPTERSPSVGKGFLLRRIRWRQLVIASLGALVVLAVMFLRVMTVYRACYRDTSSVDHWVGLTDFCRWSTWPFDPYELFQNGGPGFCRVPLWLGQGLVCGLMIERFLPALKALYRAIRITTENAVGLAAIAGIATFLTSLKFLNAHDPLHGLSVGLVYVIIALSLGVTWGTLLCSPLLVITGKRRRAATLLALASGICGAMLPLLLWLECLYMFLWYGSR